MELGKAKAIVGALVSLRNLATDEQALSVTALYPKWKARNIMVHNDIGVTLNTYTHVEFEDAQEEMRRIREA